jgi:transposase
MPKRQPTYTTDFKHQIANLVQAGKSSSEISKEYGISKTTVKNWYMRYINSGSFKTEDNRSDDEKELRALRKENKKLKMEVDILKQAALILGRNAE